MLRSFIYRGKVIMVVKEDGLATIRTNTGWTFFSATGYSSYRLR